MDAAPLMQQLRTQCMGRAAREQRLREELQAEIRQREEQTRMEYDAKMQRELEVLRDEMGVLYRTVQELRLQVESTAGAVGELEARTNACQQQLRSELDAELASLQRSVRYVARRLP